MRLARLVRLGLALAILALAGSGPLWAGDTKYLVDKRGEASVSVGMKGDAAYRLAPADLAAYRRNRQRLVDLLLAQPAARPPIGVSLWVDAKAGSPVRASELEHPTWPVPTLCYVHFNSIIERDGKAVWANDSPVEMSVFVNDPEGCGFPSYSNGELRDSQGHEIFYEPNKVGEIQGFTLYRDEHGTEILVLTRGHRPPWVPLTQEEFIRAWIRTMEKQLAELGAYGKDPSNLLRLRLERHRVVLAAMSPAERQAPALYLRNEDALEPDLAPPGGQWSWPLVIANPQWFDAALPRSAFQFISVVFEYEPHFDPDDPQPDDVGAVESVRLSDMKRTSDWKALSESLAP